MKNRSKKNGINKTTALAKCSPMEASEKTANAVRHADNYEVEVIGIDEIREMVLSGELLLIMDHLREEIAADNY
jgi:hypothetical protein